MIFWWLFQFVCTSVFIVQLFGALCWLHQNVFRPFFGKPVDFKSYGKWACEFIKNTFLKIYIYSKIYLNKSLNVIAILNNPIKKWLTSELFVTVFVTFWFDVVIILQYLTQTTYKLYFILLVYSSFCSACLFQRNLL